MRVRDREQLLRAGLGSAPPRRTRPHSLAGYLDDAEATRRKIARSVFAPGDAYYRSGDLLRMDSGGRYHFVNRIGDTFRWRGENVSTSEVEGIMSRAPGVAEAIVYGVAIPGHDGRAGMAALVLQDGSMTLDGEALARYALASLAPFAVPLFVRLLARAPLTETFKHIKRELAEQGADPTLVAASSEARFLQRHMASGGVGAGPTLWVLMAGRRRDASLPAGGAGAGAAVGAAPGLVALVDSADAAAPAAASLTGDGPRYVPLTLELWHAIVAGQARL